MAYEQLSVGVDEEATHCIGQECANEGPEGVLCRIALLASVGFKEWDEPQEEWAELAIFVGNLRNHPRLVERRKRQAWLLGQGDVRAAVWSREFAADGC